MIHWLAELDGRRISVEVRQQMQAAVDEIRRRGAVSARVVTAVQSKIAKPWRCRTRLVKEMGGVNAVKAASLEELLAPSWLPDDVGLAVYHGIHKTGGR